MKQQHWFCSTSFDIRRLASLVVTASLLYGANAAAQTYQLIDLATLSQGSPVVVRGPNNTGVGVGGGRVAGSTSPPGGLVFQNGAGPRPIARLPGSGDNANLFGVNNSGGVVGSANSPSAVRAFASSLSGGVRELPPLPGDTSSMAFALNNFGQAVGYSSGPAGERAVSWDGGGTPGALPGFPGMSRSQAQSVNDRGDVTGIVVTAAGRRAVLWPGGGTGTLLALPTGGVKSEAFAINARGDVVGYSADAAGVRRAALWPLGGAVVDIGTLPGGNFSQAFGSNDAGAVVGSSTSSAGDRAFLWTPGGGLQDLNALVPPSQFVLTKAAGINNLGMIIAIGYGASTAPSHGHVETHELPVRVFLLVH